MANIREYETADVEERNTTNALRDLFESAAKSGTTEDPLSLVCKSLVRCIDVMQFAFYCYKGDETGQIASVKQGVSLFLPPPDVARKVVANMWKAVKGGGVAVISPEASLSLLSPAQRRRWKCHTGCVVRVDEGGRPVAVVAAFLPDDFVVTDRHRAWMSLFGKVASSLVTLQRAFAQVRDERMAALRAQASATADLEHMREGVRRHLQEFLKTRGEVVAGGLPLRDALLAIEKSAHALYGFSNVAAHAPKGASAMKNRTFEAWVRKGLKDRRIKAIVGLRGSNKSGLLHAVCARVRSSGVDASRIVFIDFEDARFRRFKTPHDVIAYLDAFPKPRKKNYLFLDEVGMIEWHTDLLKRLKSYGGWNIWMATSTAHALRAGTGEGAANGITSYRVWTDPALPRTQGELEKIWCQIFMRDVVGGTDHPDIRAKEFLAEYFSDHIGEVRSLRDIATEMAERGRKIALTSISTYRQALVDAYLIEMSEVYDLFEGRVVTSGAGRPFYTDLELRTWRYGHASEHDATRVALNRLYLELRQSHDKVYTPRSEDADFVTLEANGKPRLWRLPQDPLLTPAVFRGGGVNSKKSKQAMR